MNMRFVPLGACFAAVLSGCGGGAGTTGGGGGGGGGNPPSFTMSASPGSISVNQQGSAQKVQLSITPQNGFTGSVTVTPGVLPAGISVSPASVSVTAGSPQTVNVSATATSSIAQQSINFYGTSGNLSASTTLSVTVKPALVSDPFHSVGGELTHGVYDQSRQLLFVANLALNEIDVFSGADDTVKARIPVPQPLSVDLMADGNTLVVGTETQQVVTVDENSYAVTRHPFTEDLVGETMFFPTVTALANGKVLVIGQVTGQNANDQEDGGQALFLWDSAADTMTLVQSATPEATWEVDHLARSADHKWAVFSADKFYLYSSDAGSFTSVPLTTVFPEGSDVRGYALNSDGSTIAVATADRVRFFDRSFNTLGTAQLTSAFQNTGSAVIFSRDDSTLYLSYQVPLMLEEVDAKGFAELGMLSASVNPDSDPLENMIDVDASGHAYFNIDGGIRVVDLTQPPAPNTYQVLAPPTCPPLQTVLGLNAETQVSIQYAPGISFYVGGQPATLSADGSELTVPSSAMTGPVDVECVDSNKNMTVNAQDVSYGTEPVAFSASLLPPAGGPTAYVFGFGFTASSSDPVPAVTFNGNASSSVSNLSNPGIGVLEGVAAQAPAGTAGAAVSIEVSGKPGSGSLSSAAAYYAGSTILSASGIQQLTFDTHRNRLYALKANEVDVLDASTQNWLTPLAFPASLKGPAVSLGITPDGTSLVVYANNGQPEILVLDPDGVAAPTVNSYSGYCVLSGSFAITNRETVLLAGTPGIVFDLSTLAFSPLTATTGGVIRASADGTHVYSAALNVSSGMVYAIDPTTFAETSGFYGGNLWSDLAVSADGSEFAAIAGDPVLPGAGVGFYNAAVQVTNVAVYPDYSPPEDIAVLGPAFSPGGKVLVMPLGDSIELRDAQAGTLRHRLMTPEELQVFTYPDTPLNPMLALNAAGDTIFAVSKSGLSILRLSGPMDQLQPVEWPNAVFPGGLPTALRSSMARRMQATGAARILASRGGSAKKR